LAPPSLFKSGLADIAPLSGRTVKSNVGESFSLTLFPFHFRTLASQRVEGDTSPRRPLGGGEKKFCDRKEDNFVKKIDSILTPISFI
jgi:hypothetical protein